MWTHNLDPVLFSLGPLQIRWYGLVYVLGFFLAVYWLRFLSRRGVLELDQEQIWDMLFYLMVGVLVGSRLFMIFWRPDIYLANPLNLFKIWEGGMSFHGGFVGIVTACWLYCRRKNISFWRMTDVLAAPAMLALALGRVANFINAELVGRPFQGKWCVVFPEYDEICRHPNMIYSAFQRLLVFGWLLFLSLRNSYSAGFIFWNFVFWEGLGRFLMDFFREDVLHYGLSLGQWFSLLMIAAAVIVFWKKYQEDWKKMVNL